MGDRGPAPTPTVIKEARGTLEKTRVSQAEPQWRTIDPGDVPDDLDGDDAIAEWRRLADELDPQGLRPAVARGVLIGVCNAWAAYLRATRELAKPDGWVTKAESGYQMPSAWVAIRSKTWAEYINAIVQFGATPSSAGKVTARPKAEDADELARKREARRAAR